MRYVSSLDVSVDATGPYLFFGAAQERAFRHLFRETVVTLPEGLVCELPTLDIRRVTTQIGTAAALYSPDLSIDIASIAGDGKVVNVKCSGVAIFRGGTRQALASKRTYAAGAAFIASSYETISATYHWLTQRQLFGVGTVVGNRDRSDEPWQLDFTFDLYAAF